MRRGVSVQLFLYCADMNHLRRAMHRRCSCRVFNLFISAYSVCKVSKKPTLVPLFSLLSTIHTIVSEELYEKHPLLPLLCLVPTRHAYCI